MKNSDSSAAGSNGSPEKVSPLAMIEEIIRRTVQEGYDHSLVVSAVTELQKEGLSQSNIDTAVLEVISYIRCNEFTSLPKVACYVKEDVEVLSRLQKAASVPSVLNVLVGFTKWYHTMPVADRAFLYDESVLCSLFKNIMSSFTINDLRPSAVSYFCLLFSFSTELSSTLFDSLKSLSQIPLPQGISLDSILHSFIQSILSSRPSDRRFHIQQIVDSLQQQLKSKLEPLPTKNSLEGVQKQAQEIASLMKNLHELASIQPTTSTPVTFIFPSDLESATYDKVHAIQNRRKVLLEQLRSIQQELSRLDTELVELAAESKGSHQPLKQQVDDAVRPMISALNQEVKPVAMTWITGIQSTILQRCHQFTIRAVKQIRVARSKLQSLTSEMDQLGEEKKILQTLKLNRNTANVEKELHVNEVLMQRWRNEESTCLQEINRVEKEVAWVVAHYTLTAMDKESVAHIYSLLSLVGVSPSLDDVSPFVAMINSFREGDRVLTKEAEQKKDKPRKDSNTKKPKRSWKQVQRPPVCSMDDIQKEELSKRQ